MSDSNGVENALWIKGNVEKQAGVELKKKKKLQYDIHSKSRKYIFITYRMVFIRLAEKLYFCKLQSRT